MLEFGIPKQRVAKKPELFPNTPVITMQGWEGKGYNKKFVFNKTALEVLNIEPGLSRVNFAFDGDSAYVAKQPGEDSVMVGKNNSISNKKFYDYITKIYNLDMFVDNHLELTSSVHLGDITAFLLQTIEEATVDNHEEDSPVTSDEAEETMETEDAENVKQEAYI